MKQLAAYLLLVLGGNASPSVEDIKKVLSSVGIETDENQATKLITSLEGKVRVCLLPSSCLCVCARC